ncbi:MAG: phage minor head protein [Firmicutes bacterium]|nr:phage minor head protein [Bacillota bacterium]
MFAKKRDRRLVSRKARKSGEAKNVLDRLNEYLDAEDSEPVQWLTWFWDDQQKAITYKELREAIIAGQISEVTLQEWQTAYSKLVTERMKPLWLDAMIAANRQVASIYGEFYFDPTTRAVRDWIESHGGEWITVIQDEQQKAITAMLDKAYSGDWTVDELARVIRPTIGLTRPQAEANINYYKHVRESLLKDNPTMQVAAAEKRAREAALKYAAKQHRQRAHVIATTEMAFAYNKGADEGIKQAQARGYIGKVKRVWSTADDELVCEVCGGLEGTAIDMEEEFDFKGRSLYGGQKQTPPAHPRCRCAVLYEEVEPPSFEEIKLDYGEEYAIKSYVSSESYKINEKLRNGLPLTPEDYTFTTNLDSALSKMPRYEGTLTRSLSFLDPRGMAEFLKQHKKGNIIKYDQYISTTKGAIYNPDALVQIIIIYATTGRDISAFNFAEKEILYERGSKFRVVDVNDTENGGVLITLEEEMP